MTKKMYFMIRPENFIIYDGISREGEFSFNNCDSFNMDDDFYDKIIFISKRKKLKGRVNVKELVTGTKFILKVIPRVDEPDYVKIYSNKLNLRTSGELATTQVSIPNEKATGFFLEMKENDELKQSYVNNILQFFANARVKLQEYKKDQEGPDVNTIKSLRKISKSL